jgi:hypothetical protein
VRIQKLILVKEFEVITGINVRVSPVNGKMKKNVANQNVTCKPRAMKMHFAP